MIYQLHLEPNFIIFFGESIISQLDDKKNHKTKDRLGYIKKCNSKLICGKKIS